MHLLNLDYLKVSQMKRIFKYGFFSSFLISLIICGSLISLLTKQSSTFRYSQKYCNKSGNTAQVRIPQEAMPESEIKIFEDKYFEKVLRAFKERNLNSSKRIFKQGDMPTFYLYCDNITKMFWQVQLRPIVNECPYQCRVTGNLSEASRVDAVVWHLRDLKDRKFVKKLIPKRDLSQPWIVLTFEGPMRANSYHSTYEQFNSLFNRTMTYRKDADIIVNHGFIVSKEDSTYLPDHWRIMPENLSSVVYENNKAVIVGMISNCEETGRFNYINELQKHIKVDFYGKCGILKCGNSLYPEHDYKPNKEKCLIKFGTSYMFYLAFENAFCTDYGTEKIYNLLYYPIVPIVYGGINYEEILPPNSYINVAYYSPQELANYINYLISNPNEYQKYFMWKKYYVPSTIGGLVLMCDLCTRLHDPNFYKYNVIEDFNKWFLKDSECGRKWTIDNRCDLTYKSILE